MTTYPDGFLDDGIDEGDEPSLAQEFERLLARLETEFSGIVVIAVTNRADDLDPALARRFNVSVPLPGEGAAAHDGARDLPRDEDRPARDGPDGFPYLTPTS